MNVSVMHQVYLSMSVKIYKSIMVFLKKQQLCLFHLISLSATLEVTV